MKFASVREIFEYAFFLMSDSFESRYPSGIFRLGVIRKFFKKRLYAFIEMCDSDDCSEIEMMCLGPKNWELNGTNPHETIDEGIHNEKILSSYKLDILVRPVLFHSQMRNKKTKILSKLHWIQKSAFYQKTKKFWKNFWHINKKGTYLRLGKSSVMKLDFHTTCDNNIFVEYLENEIKQDTRSLITTKNILPLFNSAFCGVYASAFCRIVKSSNLNSLYKHRRDEKASPVLDFTIEATRSSNLNRSHKYSKQNLDGIHAPDNLLKCFICISSESETKNYIHYLNCKKIQNMCKNTFHSTKCFYTHENDLNVGDRFECDENFHVDYSYLPENPHLNDRDAAIYSRPLSNFDISSNTPSTLIKKISNVKKNSKGFVNDVILTMENHRENVKDDLEYPSNFSEKQTNLAPNYSCTDKENIYNRNLQTKLNQDTKNEKTLYSFCRMQLQSKNCRAKELPELFEGPHFDLRKILLDFTKEPNKEHKAPISVVRTLVKNSEGLFIMKKSTANLLRVLDCAPTRDCVADLHKKFLFLKNHPEFIESTITRCPYLQDSTSYTENIILIYENPHINTNEYLSNHLPTLYTYKKHERESLVNKNSRCAFFEFENGHHNFINIIYLVNLDLFGLYKETKEFLRKFGHRSQLRDLSMHIFQTLFGDFRNATGVHFPLNVEEMAQKSRSGSHMILARYCDPTTFILNANNTNDFIHLFPQASCDFLRRHINQKTLKPDVPELRNSHEDLFLTLFLDHNLAFESFAITIMDIGTFYAPSHQSSETLDLTIIFGPKDPNMQISRFKILNSSPITFRKPDRDFLQRELCNNMEEIDNSGLMKSFYGNTLIEKTTTGDFRDFECSLNRLKMFSNSFQAENEASTSNSYKNIVDQSQICNTHVDALKKLHLSFDHVHKNISNLGRCKVVLSTECEVIDEFLVSLEYTHIIIKKLVSQIKETNTYKKCIRNYASFSKNADECKTNGAKVEIRDPEFVSINDIAYANMKETLNYISDKTTDDRFKQNFSEKCVTECQNISGINDSNMQSSIHLLDTAQQQNSTDTGINFSAMSFKSDESSIVDIFQEIGSCSFFSDPETFDMYKFCGVKNNRNLCEKGSIDIFKSPGLDVEHKTRKSIRKHPSSAKCRYFGRFEKTDRRFSDIIDSFCEFSKENISESKLHTCKSEIMHKSSFWSSNGLTAAYKDGLLSNLETNDLQSQNDSKYIDSLNVSAIKNFSCDLVNYEFHDPDSLAANTNISHLVQISEKVPSESKQIEDEKFINNTIDKLFNAQQIDLNKHDNVIMTNQENKTLSIENKDTPVTYWPEMSPKDQLSFFAATELSNLDRSAQLKSPEIPFAGSGFFVCPEKEKLNSNLARGIQSPIMSYEKAIECVKHDSSQVWCGDENGSNENIETFTDGMNNNLLEYQYFFPPRENQASIYNFEEDCTKGFFSSIYFNNENKRSIPTNVINDYDFRFPSNNYFYDNQGAFVAANSLANETYRAGSHPFPHFDSQKYYTNIYGSPVSQGAHIPTANYYYSANSHFFQHNDAEKIYKKRRKMSADNKLRSERRASETSEVTRSNHFPDESVNSKRLRFKENRISKLKHEALKAQSGIKKPKIEGNYLKETIKPPFSFSQLIIEAISESKDGKMLLKDIYKEIESKYPYYKQPNKTWYNSIRHNLTMNKHFVKIKKEETQKGKGNFWTLDKDQAQEIFSQYELIKRSHEEISESDN